MAELGPRAVIAGRAAARLHALDGFESDACEFLVPYADRGHRCHALANAVVHATRRFPTKRDRTTKIGLPCLRAEATIVTSTLFGFTQRETENSIDAAVRRRLIAERKLRTRIVETDWQGVRNAAVLVESLVDTGGESPLERWFLALVRRAGLPRPQLRVNVRKGSATIARLDALFGDRLVVELAGHEGHSSRQSRQRDEQRRTALTLQGYTVITFVYEDVRRRPEWVASQVRRALTLIAAS